MSNNLYRAVVWFDAQSFDEAVSTLRMDGYTVTSLEERDKSDD